MAMEKEAKMYPKLYVTGRTTQRRAIYYGFRKNAITKKPSICEKIEIVLSTCPHSKKIGPINVIKIFLGQMIPNLVRTGQMVYII